MTKRAKPHSALYALYVHDSQNAKLGGADATYASIAATCDRACPLYNAGCYAQGGKVALTEGRLDATVSTATAARHEAAAIDGAYRGGAIPEGRDLRLHVSGDARTSTAARILAAAASRWLARGGRAVWSYTHAWRRVARDAWGAVSTLASVERPSQGAEAMRQGYAPALVVDRHPPDGRAWESHGIKWIPCPAQTRGVACVDCRLCLDADALRARKAGITFAVHGASRKRALTVIQQVSMF